MLKLILTYKGAPKERITNANMIAKEIQGFVYVGGTDTIKNVYNMFLKAFKAREDLLMLEDDVILTSDFLQKINSYIEKYKEKVINFHFIDNRVSETIVIDGKHFIWNQCVFIPFTIIEKCVELFTKFTLKCQYEVKTRQQDKILAFVLNEIDAQFVVTRPCLVKQHDWLSTMWDKPSVIVETYEE